MLVVGGSGTGMLGAFAEINPIILFFLVCVFLIGEDCLNRLFTELGACYVSALGVLYDFCCMMRSHEKR